MSLIPESEKQHSDYLDFLADACKTRHEYEKTDGTVEVKLETDPKIVRYKTQMVDSVNFARFVYELEGLENLAYDAQNHMCEKKAIGLANQILRKVKSYMYSIDATSSIVRRDNDNTRSSLTHLMTKSKEERTIHFRGETKQSFIDSFRGKQQQREIEE